MTNEHPDYLEPDGGERAARASLEPFAASLRSGAVWADPPPDLADRVVAAVERHPPASTPRPAFGVDIARLTRRRTPRPAILMAAAVVAAFVTGLLVAGRGGDGDDDRRDAAIAEVTLIATEAAAGATASGEVFDRGAGYALILQVDGLAPAAEGEFYEGWLVAGNDWVSVGTFHLRGGDGVVVLWSGVPVARYDRLVVTTQEEGVPPGDAYGSIVLDGQVTDASA